MRCRLAVLLFLAIVSGCHLVYPYQGVAEEPRSDGGPRCLPEGIATRECVDFHVGCCSPLDPRSCAAGACYLQSNAPACVCPVGAKGVGTACGLNTECGPGLQCIQLPGALNGVCVRLCLSAEQCSGNPCNLSQPLHGFGVCLADA